MLQLLLFGLDLLPLLPGQLRASFRGSSLRTQRGALVKELGIVILVAIRVDSPEASPVGPLIGLKVGLVLGPNVILWLAEGGE